MVDLVAGKCPNCPRLYRTYQDSYMDFLKSFLSPLDDDTTALRQVINQDTLTYT